MTNLSSASTSTPLSIRVVAPAKINLVLRILDRRTDGYHNLWSLMQTVQVEDEITIAQTDTHPGVTLRCDDPSLKADGSNLVYRAAMAVMEQSGWVGGLDITLAKRIPMGAGLGGGSSDAAATILGLNQLFNLGWSAEKMAHIGQTLGSDVPFFFFAPSATVAGRGEQVAPVRIKGTRWVVLVNPGFPVETKWAYQQLSANRAGVAPLSRSHAMLEQVSELGWEQVLEAAENDFEGPVFKTYSMLQEIKQRLLAHGAEAALLSGSGATVFGVFREEAKARQAQALFMNEPQFKVFVAQTSHPSS
ncbi:4-diphosphocytidyl-2-C-methyl-D-erythritol kinase [Candidatus Nitrospira nitrosa]|uniref:4-diphosphocytidyl-2-C-methyl-D-erythritol kinase n=1 Tax=Candidatus Nitrospira nitrosa TaxID=1742972 RepID=A0A0S4LF06_9BACT|nr:4-(cytidine 5'-diphospho)-2-C-methyl-D-erythritol kinase [Candidatus Nitrospira nitrosa]CUS34534.1 4-diphosphocytidyl-2-C-methyl-D-erythritol kinase [Candidatus Nitrospira nitrosa]